MPASTGVSPELSVVVPTYNRAELLRRTLEALARQRLPLEDYEVIVSDDGSSDGTPEVVKEYASRLQLKYHFQEDLGYRAPTARNAGARLATAPILSLVDCGVLVNQDFVQGHLHAHERDEAALVVGPSYGYRPRGEVAPGLAQAAATLPPDEIYEKYRDEPLFTDWRHREFLECHYDLGRRVAPWVLAFSQNISIPTRLYLSLGGFDEDWNSWGVEDLEFAFRVHRAGVPFRIQRPAWSIESPHERDMEANTITDKQNIEKFLKKFPQPATELAWGVYMHDGIWEIEYECRALLACARETRDLDVHGELAEAAARLGVPGPSVAVFGCGGSIPPELSGSVLIDFDPDLLRAANAGGGHDTHHAVGVRTMLPDQSVDAVVITTRLRPLWPRWGDDILAEAERIGRSVHGSLLSERRRSPLLMSFGPPASGGRTDGGWNALYRDQR